MLARIRPGGIFGRFKNAGGNAGNIARNAARNAAKNTVGTNGSIQELSCDSQRLYRYSHA